MYTPEDFSAFACQAKEWNKAQGQDWGFPLPCKASRNFRYFKVCTLSHADEDGDADGANEAGEPGASDMNARLGPVPETSRVFTNRLRMLFCWTSRIMGTSSQSDLRCDISHLALHSVDASLLQKRAHIANEMEASAAKR